ncbi:thioredoxin domain-containing protein [Pontixanthobacter aquaemixtae]|uniref:Thioredoxin domain-containing protein n=1 Tax=Pontixanthobacter aquaemixtae TaxID=1958940 RepID=A0A844ZVD3_9SPHN|nr:thioredoxin domain-containing protein [Pontixanthobacter aquaemixtae]MXO90717.1 thioredoxin domain-containing protein [Pontixanthobacter aquaemixtae]
MTILRKIALATFAAPLALGLAACNSEADDVGVEEGAQIAPIAAPEGTAWTEVVNVSEEGGYVLGNPDAPLKVVEYASHTCGACAQFSVQGGPPLQEEYVNSGRVSYELRNLVRDPIDLVISTMARCGEPAAFIPRADQAWASFNEVMGGAQSNGQALQQAMEMPEEQRYVAIAEAAGLFGFFQARGLPRDQAQTCLADVDNVKAIAERSAAQSNELGVNATPTFFLNGRKLDVNQWPGLEPILQRAGAR